eukprot:SAG31_NODE_12_length_38498_cov_21.161671_12_plen_175_part_00
MSAHHGGRHRSGRNAGCCKRSLRWARQRSHGIGYFGCICHHDSGSRSCRCSIPHRRCRTQAALPQRIVSSASSNESSCSYLCPAARGRSQQSTAHLSSVLAAAASQERLRPTMVLRRGPVCAAATVLESSSAASCELCELLRCCRCCARLRRRERRGRGTITCCATSSRTANNT